MNNNKSDKDKISRREALKRIGLLAGTGALMAAGSTSLLSMLTGCSDNSSGVSNGDDKTVKQAAAYNDTFPEYVEEKPAEDGVKNNAIKPEAQKKVKEEKTTSRKDTKKPVSNSTPQSAPERRQYSDLYYSNIYTDA